MKLILLVLIVGSFTLNLQAEQKFNFNNQNKVIETITIKEKNLKLDFKILCINGYQYLYRFGSGDNPVQMFSKDKKSRQSVPISCNGFEDSDEK